MAETETHDGRNSIDPQMLNRYVSDIERKFDEIATLTGEHMNRCKQRRDEIKAYKKQAKKAGIPLKELNALIDQRKLERKIAELRDDMEEDQVETLDMMIEALGEFGDSPLGAAAIDRKKKQQETDSALDAMGED